MCATQTYSGRYIGVKIHLKSIYLLISLLKLFCNLMNRMMVVRANIQKLIHFKVLSRRLTLCRCIASGHLLRSWDRQADCCSSSSSINFSSLLWLLGLWQCTKCSTGGVNKHTYTHTHLYARTVANMSHINDVRVLEGIYIVYAPRTVGAQWTKQLKQTLIL